MSRKNFEIALDFLFPSEGGYVNDKDDLGGPTNMGVTQTSYNTYRKQHNLPIKDVKYITRNEAVDLYYENYWKISGADAIDDPNLAVTLFDTAVLHGPYIAKEYYKKSNGDLNKFLDIRQKSYDAIVAKNPSQKKYYNGWNNRVKNLKNSIQNNKFIKGNSNLPSNLQNNPNINITPPQENQTMLLEGRVEENEFIPYGYEKQNLLMWENIPFINPVSNSNQSLISPNHTFTPDEIGAMTPDEFSQNEAEIMKQVQQGQVKNEAPKIDYSNYKNPKTGKSMVYTREDIGNMSTEEFTQHEKAINAQLQAIGIPNKSDIPSNIQTHTIQKAANGNGRWVTINGNHVFIEE